MASQCHEVTCAQHKTRKARLKKILSTRRQKIQQVLCHGVVCVPTRGGEGSIDHDLGGEKGGCGVAVVVVVVVVVVLERCNDDVCVDTVARACTG